MDIFPSTPICVAYLCHELSSHPDREFVNYLCNGLLEGFDTLVSTTDLPKKEWTNLQSALSQPSAVDKLIDEELKNNFLQGPFDKPPFNTCRVSPIGVVTGRYSDKKRLILDLSAPHDSKNHYSVHELIDKDMRSMTYITVDDAIRTIRE